MSEGGDLNLAMRLYMEAAGFNAGLTHTSRDLKRWSSGARSDIKSVSQEFESMVGHFTRGLAALAGDHYLIKPLRKGVEDAASMQNSLLSIKQILQGSHPHAKLLADEMKRVKDNAISISRETLYGVPQVLDVTRQLIQGGVPLKAILGKHGAALAVETLAETQGTVPGTTAADLANVGHSFQFTGSQYGAAADLIARAGVTASGSLTELMYTLGRSGAISKAALLGAPGSKNPLDALKMTLAALKTLSPLGEQSGSDYVAVLQTMENARFRGSRYMRAYGLDFFDKKGNFVGLPAAIRELQAEMKKLPTQQARLQALGHIFQAGGSAAAQLLIAPSKPGAKSFLEILAAIDQQASLAQQREVKMSGLSSQGDVLRHNLFTSAAQIYAPVIGPITDLTRQLSKLTSLIGNAAENHPTLDKLGLGIGGAVVGGVGIYGLTQLFKGVGAGSRMLRGLGKGLFGVGAGVAEGKALEGVAGVMPVFVVNFPGQKPFAGLPGVPAAGAAAGAGAETGAAGAVASRWSGTLGTVARWLPVVGLMAEDLSYGLKVAQRNAPIKIDLDKQLHDYLHHGLSPGLSGGRGEGHLKISIDSAGRASVQQLSVQGGMPQITVDTGPRSLAAAP